MTILSAQELETIKHYIEKINEEIKKNNEELESKINCYDSELPDYEDYQTVSELNEIYKKLKNGNA